MSWELKYGIPNPIVIGHEELSEEKLKKSEETLHEILREIGVLKDDETDKVSDDK